MFAQKTDRAQLRRVLDVLDAGDVLPSHGRLMLTVLGGLAEFERDLIPGAHRRRPGAGRGARAENGPTVQTHRSPETLGDQSPRPR
jgi:DNA invertase Pin-like site-specific DNA recombinase